MRKSIGTLQYHSLKSWFLAGHNPRLMVTVVLLLVVTGSYLLLRSYAATPALSIEVENGSLSDGAAVVTASDASGGKAVSFPAPLTGGSLSQIPNPPLPTVETVSYSGMSGDISDDSAIYANPTDPSKSVVVADNKASSGGGIAVFDMQGKMLQFRKDGKIGNVDLRSNVMLGGQSTVLVGANNRTNNTLSFWKLDPSTGQLSSPVMARTLSTSTGSPNYGFCMYKSAQTGKLYAFVTPDGAGSIEQYEIKDSGGKVDVTKVRTISISSITEACVADDDLGYVYFAQEDVALWRYGAEPGDGSTRTAVDHVGGHVVADIEGMSLAYGPDNTGYLVVSSQGNSTFAVYDRKTNAFMRNFTVGSNGSIDGCSSTDGLDITTSSLGPGFTKGALVVHDASNSGGSTSNLKYVPLQ